jgi:hypothetical protein
MPGYIGRGMMFSRLKQHSREVSRKNQYWDRFSWFVVANTKYERELESLLLEALPFYVRSLNKQTGKLPRKNLYKHASDDLNYVALPTLPPLRRKR